jgi:hypothetical protein
MIVGDTLNAISIFRALICPNILAIIILMAFLAFVLYTESAVIARPS